ncbi:BMP family lipoprotein [Lutispora saccharofermentans]|uniref:BMP family ABC transporter substrate-binding protein n=1 Tax=Lutispora saccharofermentans TaxID=3024236 RepID=A0ABT1NAQ5_9FIRM|nr:BMP family ABC transporter substrate-binding protein [Lutispora saccharofermentans]
MTKRTISLLLALVMVFALFTGCAKPAPQPEQGQAPAEPEKPKYSFGMVTDVGGIGDKSFNDSAWAGIEKAGQELGVEPKLLQSTKQDDYTPNLGSMAQSVDLTMAVGFLFEDAMKTSADQYADKKFGAIDITTPLEKENVMQVNFKEHEGSFLVGVIAGLTTKTNVIGFVGGMDFPVIRRFEAGFIAGVKSANPNAKVIVNYTGAFDNPDKGKEVALTQHQQKADVIFHASGGCGIGVIQAADEKGFWAIGVDQDQSAVSNNNKVLCSMIKRVDVGTYTIVKAYADNTFKGGVTELGLKEEGVGYSDGGKNVSAELAAQVEKYKAAINDGTIAVPATREELETFKPVEIK